MFSFLFFRRMCGCVLQQDFVYPGLLSHPTLLLESRLIFALNRPKAAMTVARDNRHSLNGQAAGERKFIKMSGQ